MEDFNLAKLIYQFSNALIEESFINKYKEVEYITEDRSCLVLYNKDSITRQYGFINGFRGHRYKRISHIYSRIYFKQYQKNKLLKNRVKNSILGSEKEYRKFRLKKHLELFSKKVLYRRSYKSNSLVKISDKHFVKFSKTNVVYHYFGSNNRTKMSDRQRTKESYKRRFYNRKLQYGTFFYSLPKRFDIREDWNKVLFSYLNHINNI